MPSRGVDAVTMRRFPARVNSGGAPDDPTLAWMDAKEFGFLTPRSSTELAARIAGTFVRDRRTLAGIYDAGPAGPGWSADRPVATCATMTKGMNVGTGRDLAIRLIADVTVRATHRGRGLMREMIVDELRRARDQRIPAVALYAARATLYGRYGFGPATRSCQVEVTTRDFGLAVPSRIPIALADPARLTEAVADLHRQHHRLTFGSIEMLSGYPLGVCGLGPGDHSAGDAAVNAFAHLDPDGHPDGIITYRFHGWTPPRSTIEIIDVLAVDPDVETALWAAVCLQDLADVVLNRHRPPDDPLPWSLTDRRAYRQTLTEDGLWLRLLDVPGALSARAFHGPDGTLTIDVADPLGLANGTFRVQVFNGQSSVTSTTDDADVALSISSLSSLYLGGYSAHALAAAGLISAHRRESVDVLNQMFRTPVAPYNNTHF